MLLTDREVCTFFFFLCLVNAGCDDKVFKIPIYFVRGVTILLSVVL